MMIGSRRGSSSSGGSSGAGAGTETAATLPAPTDGSVRLSVAGGEVVAGLRFSGYITPQTAEAARKQLMAALEQGEQLPFENLSSGFFFRALAPSLSFHASCTHLGCGPCCFWSLRGSRVRLDACRGAWTQAAVRWLMQRFKAFMLALLNDPTP